MSLAGWPDLPSFPGMPRPDATAELTAIIRGKGSDNAASEASMAARVAAILDAA